MSRILVIISVIVLYNNENILCMKTCRDNTDCMVVPLCPEAQKLNVYRKKNETIQKKFISSICGHTSGNNGRHTIKVCCSDFKEAPSLPVRFGNEDEVDLSRHNSLKLLPNACGATLEDRIMGGDIADLGEFPWLALIAFEHKQSNGTISAEFACGATIINSRYILTAAHCVDNKKVAFVRLGEYDISNEVLDCQGKPPNVVCQSYTQDVQVEIIVVHEDYHLTPITENDIALLRLTEEIKFSLGNVEPICLPIYKELIESKLSGRMVKVVGWGITELGQLSSVPLKVSVPVLTDERCDNSHKRNIICAGGNGKDSCQGDSGGPLMLLDEFNSTYSMIQYGIDVQVEIIVVHEDYHLTPITENDIALLRLTEEIKFSLGNVEPICLPIYKELIESKLSGRMVKVVGWGITELGQLSSVPLKVSVPVLTDERCDNSHKRNIICAGGNGKDSCQGDSGGPLMLLDEFNSTYSMIQYGIVSRGPGGCQKSSNPGIYTDVRKYMRWILNNIVE